MYQVPIAPNELYHHGILGQKWGKQNGPPYPLGLSRLSPEERKDRKKQKNISIGSERLKNRIDRANKSVDVDKLSRKVGWNYTEQSGRVNKQIKEIKAVANEILENEVRTEQLGDYTRKVRIADVAITSTTASTLAIGGSALVLGVLEGPIGLVTIPVALAGVSIKAGYDYYQKTKY